MRYINLRFTYLLTYLVKYSCYLQLLLHWESQYHGKPANIAMHGQLWMRFTHTL